MLIIFKNKFLTKRIKFTSKIQIEKRKKHYESNISDNKISCKQPKIVLSFSVHHEPHVAVIIMIEINYSKSTGFYPLELFIYLNDIHMKNHGYIK